MTLGLVEQALVLGVMVLVFVTAMTSYKKPAYRRFFKILQVVQLLSLYGWYLTTAAPLAESLPLYHCRMAMFAVLLLPDKSPLKQYFALLGVFGSIAAFVHPVLDPFDFPHVTIFSFFLGHYALLGNALIYLLTSYDEERLTYGQIGLWTAAINLGLLTINLLTGGDYGFLSNPPLLGNHGLVINYILVTAALTLAISLVNLACQRLMSQQTPVF